MRPAATRLFAAFVLAFAATTAAFVLIARAEALVFPSGSAVLLFAYAAATVVVFAALAAAAARRLTGPVAALNDQLEAIEPGSSRRVQVGSDDPEMRELEARVNALLSRVDESLKSLRGYATQVAHELRTPLTVLRLKIEQAAGAVEPQLAEDLQGELLRLTMLVEQALLAARAEQGAVRPEKKVVDLRALLEEAAEDFRLVGAEQGREVEVSACSAPVLADAKMLRQVLYNLLTNSLRHGTGRVAARLREVPSGFSLLLVNRVGPAAPETLGLGLGTRVAAALVGLHDNASLRLRRGRDYYAARLFFRAA